MRAKMLLLTTLLWLTAGAQAATIEKPMPNAAQEETARALFHELRCVVCEGQSVADSDAVLAAQMRALVRRLLMEGKTPEEVLAHFRARYGEQILMTPPVRRDTLLLWLAPLLVLTAGSALVWRSTRATPSTSNDTAA